MNHSETDNLIVRIIMPIKMLNLTGIAVLLLVMVILGSSFSLALEPPTKEQLAQYQRDGTLPARIKAAEALGNHHFAPWVTARMIYNLRKLSLKEQGKTETEIGVILAPPPAWRGMPTTGNVTILALLIAFPEYPPSSSLETMESKLFGDGVGFEFPYESLRNFYRRSSYDQLEIQGNVLGWYITPNPRSAVVETTTGRENLIAEALMSFDEQGHDFTQYDNDGDGAIDYLVVIWTGPNTGWGNFWWGYMTNYSNTDFHLDGMTLDTYSWQWEARNYPGEYHARTVIHETGHALGIPDYYDYNDLIGPRGGVGGLDIMDNAWGDHNCFSKFVLEWIVPETVTSSQEEILLDPSGEYPDAVLMMPEAVEGYPFGEFFMIQNRQREGNDVEYPTDGLLIWHVDSRLDDFGQNFLYDNSFTSHKLLRLMEADGLEEIEQGNGRADAGDYYQPGDVFGPDTTPSSRRYDNTSTGKTVQNITQDGDQMTFDIADEFNDTTPPEGVPGKPSAGGATVQYPRITFSWSPDTVNDPESGIIGYFLEITTATVKAIVFSGYLGNVTEKSINTVQDGETYRARVYAVNGAGMHSDWSAFSDDVTVSLPPLCRALDNCVLNWVTMGDSHWFGQNETHYFPGEEAAQSGFISDQSQSLLETSVDGPGTLSYYWKVSSEANYDFLLFYLDDQAINAISGEVDWERQIYSIPSGMHTLSWIYVKDQAVHGGDDAGWLDRALFFTPVPGDLDLNSEIDVVDLTILFNFQVGNLNSGTDPFVAAENAADLDGSGYVDSADQVLLSNIIANQ